VERMSAVDRAWLLMDRPANPMVIIALVVLKRPLDPETLEHVLADRFLCFPRFRCVPVLDTLGARWRQAERFELKDHVQCLDLPANAGQAQLEALVGELASTPLPPTRPLWSFHLVGRYGSGSALILRIHHCYADGIALLEVLLSLCCQGPRRQGRKARTHTALSAAGGGALTAGGVEQLLHEGVQLFERSLHYALNPAEIQRAVGLGTSLAAELAHLGMMSDDPLTALKGPLTGTRRVAWAEPLALEEVHVIGKLLGCTVNDVLVSVLAGALGRYLQHHGLPDDVHSVRAVVPVNLRGADRATGSLGNSFGMVFVELPIGIRHPLERLYAVHAGMQQLKGSPQALITLGLLATVGSLPAAVEEPVIALFGAKASLVASNLPGPREPLELGGTPISQLLFWVPQSGAIGTGVSMLSYCGRVQLGVMADRQLIPRPAELVQHMQDEFERLVFLVLLGAGSLND
jgi:WS/DGAT/MGAT family acyltransferase